MIGLRDQLLSSAQVALREHLGPVVGKCTLIGLVNPFLQMLGIESRTAGKHRSDQPEQKQSASLYRRELPSPPAIAFSSISGQYKFFDRTLFTA